MLRQRNSPLLLLPRETKRRTSLPRLQRLRQRRWIVFVINTNVEAFELDDAVTRRGRLDKAARVGHPVLASQLRYLGAWRSRLPPHDGLSPEHLAWFGVHLKRVEGEMVSIRSLLDSERRKAQQTNPERGREYRRKMSGLNRRAAKELTKTVTFTMLDNLAERCSVEILLSLPRRYR